MTGENETPVRRGEERYTTPRPTPVEAIDAKIAELMDLPFSDGEVHQSLRRCAAVVVLFEVRRAVTG